MVVHRGVRFVVKYLPCICTGTILEFFFPYVVRERKSEKTKPTLPHEQDNMFPCGSASDLWLCTFPNPRKRFQRAQVRLVTGLRVVAHPPPPALRPTTTTITLQHHPRLTSRAIIARPEGVWAAIKPTEEAGWRQPKLQFS